MISEKFIILSNNITKILQTYYALQIPSTPEETSPKSGKNFSQLGLLDPEWIEEKVVRREPLMVSHMAVKVAVGRLRVRRGSRQNLAIALVGFRRHIAKIKQNFATAKCEWSWILWISGCDSGFFSLSFRELMLCL
ncbi:hypothetical protein CDAR_230901 [Caerostris darwini]|uniref:Uncharacterized protein n=1 Tax=Caerostris darwini TaxID=1538125 RepID=A0AAV4S4S6_9ARAC|nr:hypothetical protein CDAR_230901 [Caerostris darwini]